MPDIKTNDLSAGGEVDQSRFSIGRQIAQYLKRGRNAVEAVGVPSNKGIAAILEEKLKERNLVPKHYKTARSTGQPALFSSFDSVAVPDFVKSQNPDGYIVGVGLGDVFYFLDSFSKESPPKGIVLADINPEVVAVGRLMVEVLNHSETQEDFVNNFLAFPENQLEERIKAVVQEIDPSWKRGVHVMWSAESRFKYMRAVHNRWINDKQGKDVIQQIIDNFPALQKLAKSGNIAFIQADFRNPDFIKVVRELPEFLNYTNIIYASNISWFSEKPLDPKNYKPLKAYEKASKPQIFSDIYDSSRPHLRIATTIERLQKEG